MLNEKLKNQIKRFNEEKIMQEDERKESLERNYLDDINNAIARGEFYENLSSSEKEDLDYKSWVDADIETLNRAKLNDRDKIASLMYKNSIDPEYLKELMVNDETYDQLIADPDTDFHNSFSSVAFDKERENNIPKNIENKYFKDEKNGEFFKKDGDQSSSAFKDEGNGKISTKISSDEIAKDIVAIAESRGWSKMKLSGTASFRRSAWLEANLKGIEAIGYKPSSKDLAELKIRKDQLRDNFIEEVTENEEVKNFNYEDFKENLKKETLENLRNSELELKKTKSDNDIENDYIELNSEEFIEKHPHLSGTIERKELALEKIKEDNKLSEEEKKVAYHYLDESIKNDLRNGVVHSKIESIKLESESNKIKRKDLEK